MYSMLDILHRELDNIIYIFVVLEYLEVLHRMTLVICEVKAAYVRYKMTVFPQMKRIIIFLSLPVSIMRISSEPSNYMTLQP